MGDMSISHHCNALFGQRSYIRCDNCAVQHDTPPSAVKEVFIQGITLDGKIFRPSDWADRLCGVMSPFRPGGPQPGSHLNYSPWCIPTLINGVRCVVVNAELREAEPMAWDFAINFAKDNNLQIAEACLIPDAPSGRR
jgi:hypothetical protein